MQSMYLNLRSAARSSASAVNRVQGWLVSYFNSVSQGWVEALIRARWNLLFKATCGLVSYDPGQYIRLQLFPAIFKEKVYLLVCL